MENNIEYQRVHPADSTLYTAAINLFNKKRIEVICAKNKYSPLAGKGSQITSVGAIVVNQPIKHIIEQENLGTIVESNGV